MAVHTDKAPQDEVWSEYVERGCRADVRKNLVLTDGGGPTGIQRKLLERETRERPGFSSIPSAIVSTSPLVRGIVTAISWFGKDIRAFAPNCLAAVWDYLEIPEEDQLSLLQLVYQLKMALAQDVAFHEVRAKREDDLRQIREAMEFVATAKVATLRKELEQRAAELDILEKHHERSAEPP